MTWLLVLVWIVLTAALSWASYWAGRNSGERYVYSRMRERMDNLREENIFLKLQNERLRWTYGYPEDVRRTEAATSSPGDIASAD